MKTFFSILLTVAALSSCAKLTNKAISPTVYSVKAPSSVSDSLIYLALGDSYTIGQSVPLNQSFPYQLVAQLNLQLKVGKPTIIATTGWDALDLINAIDTSGTTNKPYDFVTLLIGVNDQFRGIDTGSYRITFGNVLSAAIILAHSKNRVFVLSIPDYSVTPFANGLDRSMIASQIDQFNAVNKNVSINAGVNYLDITDISRQAANDPTLLAPDGLHPSAKMYALWVQRLAPMVMAQLSK